MIYLKNVKGFVANARNLLRRSREKQAGIRSRIMQKLASERAQGTTEYAILVGVLVVIAIIAITVFRPKLEELWNAIATGINGL